MKQSKLALSAVMVVAVGLFGANFVSGSDMTSESKMDAFVASSPVYGHVTVIHSDPSGNILSYMQTDNIVTIEGKDCAIESLFSTSGAADCNATTSTDVVFNTIALATGLEAPTSVTNATQANGLVARDYTNVNGLGPAVATGFTTTGATSSVGAKMDLVKIFTSSAESQPVNQAILYDSNQEALFATKQFSSVTLNTDDTLSITWSITLG